MDTNTLLNQEIPPTPSGQLSPQQMQEILLSVQARVRKGENVSDEEVRQAVSFIPILRQLDGTKPKAASRAAKEAAPSVGLDTF